VQARELAAVVARRIKAPVVSTHELGSRLHFGLTQVVKLALAALVTLVIYLLVFRFQTPMLDALGGSLHQQRPFVAPLLVAVVAPLVAWAYGIVAASLLKLIRLD
jgi:hypothetical protein